MSAHVNHETTWSLCPACGGATAEPMGLLGSTLWWRCRDCGSDYTDTCDCEEDTP
jgi:tRNA(Ile2) C34 agmatinyltransferase TiaS